MYGTYAKIRDDRGLTDYRVSKDTGIAPATLSDWKTGKTTPKADKLYTLAKYLGVTIEDLLKTEGEE
ncbi:MAG TPA: XRE family transcriptional regulator [Lachnospiraceae bacterium]|jgi:transcriptional regulator with XRE-family HTH domain|nr:XRE family transcriptional regulator [Lachnospiraceae bacterium]